MNIGFDGKRAFQNKTGLGNYVRSLVTILSHYYPQHQYHLFAPKQTTLFEPRSFDNVQVILPGNSFYKRFPTLWRRKGIVKEISTSHPDIFHGVSNELPRGIEKTTVKTVVTVHDIIFERFPETYHFEERFVHRWKIKRSCKVADSIVAISNQTKDDLINLYGVNPEKISICYQSCNPIFEKIISAEEKQRVKKKYGLPDRYYLFVSSIAPRKNLIAICRAMILLKNKIDVPLVVIGNGKKEKVEVKKLMEANDISDRLILLNELPVAKEDSFTTAADFPAIYQQALALVYPSIFEGFGMPVLEALCSGVPVICSNTSSMPEVAGDAALYFTPSDHELLAKHLVDIATNEELVVDLRRKGFQQALKFSPEQYAHNMMKIYKSIL